MKTVDVCSASSPRASNKSANDALRIAAHLSALERWIEMLRARGVNRNDDGLVALARRRETLAQQQLGSAAAD
jgi:hypothetical protein